MFILIRNKFVHENYKNDNLSPVNLFISTNEECIYILFQQEQETTSNYRIAILNVNALLHNNTLRLTKALYKAKGLSLVIKIAFDD